MEMLKWNPTRATLFGKFYEGILRGWFALQGYTILDGKPRVYWKRQTLPASAMNLNHAKLIEQLRLQQDSNRSHCTPDGLFTKSDGTYLIWEAKNWVMLFPGTDFKSAVWTFPWLLAQRANYEKTDLPIGGFVISWWDRESGIDECLAELRECLAPRTLEIRYTKDILEDCIEHQYDWYVSLVEKEREDIDKFFDSLVGRRQ